jgi:hypothetical protein
VKVHACVEGIVVDADGDQIDGKASVIATDKLPGLIAVTIGGLDNVIAHVLVSHEDARELGRALLEAGGAS